MRTRKAFTIFELTVSLTVISIAAAVCITHYFSRGEVTLENASVLLAKDARAAQNRCAFLRQPGHIEFFEDGDGYRTVGESGQVIFNPRTDRLFVRRYSDDGVFEGVRITAISFEGRLLRFDAFGSVETSGWIDLEFEGEHRRILVESPSGQIRIQGSSNAWKDPGY